MGKKILLIGNTSSRSVCRLKEESVTFEGTFDMVRTANIFLHDETLFVQNTELTSLPVDYDTYFFRGIGRAENRLQKIADFLKKNNKRVVEKIFAVSGLPEDKFVPESIAGVYALPEQVIVSSEKVTQDTIKDFPVVVKKAASSMGRGVAKVFSFAELYAFIQGFIGTIIIQKYYPIEYDVRILIVGDTILGGFARYKPEGEDFLTTKPGGARTALELTQKMILAATEAKKLQGLEIAGVDLFMYEDIPYILEVNASPQISMFEKVTGINAAREIVEYLHR